MAQSLNKGPWLPTTMAEWVQIEPPSRGWLVPGLVPAGGITYISGQQKLAQKTTTALAVAMGVASGRKVFGREVQQGPVLFIEAEGDWYRTRQRILALTNGLKIPTTELQHFFWSFREGIKLDNPQWQDRILETVARIKPVLVVFDALTYLKSGDENDIMAMQSVADTLQAVQRMDAAVLLLLHLNKAQGNNPKCEDPDSQIRGSSIFSNLYDVHIALRKYSRKSESISVQVLDRFGEPMKSSMKWTMESNLLEDGTRELISAKPYLGDLKPVIPESDGSDHGEALRMAFWQESVKKLESRQGDLLTRAALRKIFGKPNERDAAFFIDECVEKGYVAVVGGPDSETYVVLRRQQ
jgi:hypothetical protein